MGYQKVRAMLENGRSVEGIVANTQVFMTDIEKASDTLYRDWERILEEARRSPHQVRSLQIIKRSVASLRGVRMIVANAKKSLLLESFATVGPAKDAPITLTAEGEIFKRFSAYANDRRVTTGHGLTPGTFATTKEDAEAFVKTGADAVRRYALENKTPASNVFRIEAPKSTDLQRGIVQPAYGEPGGGVEVIFVNGSPDGTVTGPVSIPDNDF